MYMRGLDLSRRWGEVMRHAIEITHHGGNRRQDFRNTNQEEKRHLVED